MKNHNLGLYINTLLTQALGTPNTSLRPNSPSNYWPESNQKDEILKLALNSVSHLKFKKIIMNIEGDSFYQESVEAIRKHVKKIFPESEIISEEKRPSTVEEWRRSADLAEKFFGLNAPIVCWFNHDHIFVDNQANTFITEVERIFENNPQVYFTYSHQPEAISNIIRSNAFGKNTEETDPRPNEQDTYKRIDRYFYHKITTKFIDGIFVATGQGLKYLWNNLETNLGYVPRPDWWGVTHDKSVFNMIGHSREFFRHFDGYGNITTLPQMLAMTFRDFDTEGRYIPRKQIADIYSSNDIDIIKIKALGELYLRLFYETCLIALRDARVRKISGNQESQSFNQILHLVVALFLETYVSYDCALFNCEDAISEQIHDCVKHKLFARQADFSNIVWADVSSYLF